MGSFLGRGNGRPGAGGGTLPVRRPGRPSPCATLRLRWARGPAPARRATRAPLPAGAGHAATTAGGPAVEPGAGRQGGNGPARPALRERDRVVAAPGRYAGAAGATHSGSSWRGLLTRGSTACMASRSSGAGPSATSPHESQAPNASGGENHRHAVVEHTHRRVRLGGEDGEGLDRIARPVLGERARKPRAVGHPPPLPQARERHQPPVARGRRARARGRLPGAPTRRTRRRGRGRGAGGTPRGRRASAPRSRPGR